MDECKLNASRLVSVRSAILRCVTLVIALAHAARFWIIVGSINAVLSASLARAQTPAELPEGLYRVADGQYLTLVTDLPLDNDIQELPMIFDQAVKVWCETFATQPEQIAGAKVTLYLMLETNRFKQAGMIPDGLPEFKHGWQLGDQLWVMEQPSAYYRRHLMLHEGTHWFMSRIYGGYHAPWLMEGIAEWLATHRWQESQLELGIIPASNQEVPYWGRTKLIRAQLAVGTAPTIDQIWRYSSTAHQQVNAYAWSWALVVFLRMHPETAKIFDQMLKQPVMDTPTLDRWWRRRLIGKLPGLQTAWAAFVYDLDYGLTDAPGLLQLSANTQPLQAPQRFEVHTDRNWQATGWSVTAQQVLQLQASGQYTIGQTGRPWKCQPQGVTLEYHRGQPLGRLMLAIAAEPEGPQQFTQPLTVLPIGHQAKVVAPHAGELFFRVNEATSGLSDNDGAIVVQITR